MTPANVRALVCEAIGTFALAFGVSLSLVQEQPLSTPVIAALTLGIFVYIVGSISGAHLNPAVTVGLLSIRKITPVLAGAYIVAQLLGGFVARLFVFGLADSIPQVIAGNGVSIAMAEILGTFFLALGVGAVVHDKVRPAASGLTIGGSLLIGILAASSASNGVLNPAVALSIGSLSFTYALAPLIGAVAAMQLWKWMASGK